MSWSVNRRGKKARAALRGRRGSVVGLAAIAATGLGIAASGLTGAQAATGACPTGGLGDAVHPQLGVPGVTVRSSETHLSVTTGLKSYTADTTLFFTATRPLRCAALDYSAGTVLSAAVDGHRATWMTRPQKLIVRLGHTVAPGTRFSVEVHTHTIVPNAAKLPNNDFPPGVVRYQGVLQEVGQPSRAHYLVPMADYPAQKAPWRVVVDVPRGMTLAFSGRQISERPLPGGRHQFIAATGAPIAPDVLELAVGHLVLVRGPKVDGVQIRSYLPPSELAKSRRGLRLMGDQMRIMTRLLGRFPFPHYGVLLTPYGGDLETQTLTLFPETELYANYLKIARATLLHELTHEWFGDSVSIASWSDLWLAEGHATYYQYAYGQPYDPMTHKPYDTAGPAFWDKLDRMVRRALPKVGPIAVPTPATPHHQVALAPYGGEVYAGGALALYGLKTRIGEARFDQIERTFVTRYYHRSASTADYLNVVGQIAGPANRAWLHRWLYSIHPPALPTGPVPASR